MHKKVAVFFLTILGSCFQIFDDPTTTSIKELSNRAKTKKVVLLQNNGNPTVAMSLQVSILNSDYKLSGKEIGNTFTVDGGHVGTTPDSTSVAFSWIVDDTLQIDYDKKLRTFIQEKQVNSVTVLYLSG